MTSERDNQDADRHDPRQHMDEPDEPILEVLSPRPRRRVVEVAASSLSPGAHRLPPVALENESIPTHPTARWAFETLERTDAGLLKIEKDFREANRIPRVTPEEESVFNAWRRRVNQARAHLERVRDICLEVLGRETAGLLAELPPWPELPTFAPEDTAATRRDALQRAADQLRKGIHTVLGQTPATAMESYALRAWRGRAANALQNIYEIRHVQEASRPRTGPPDGSVPTTKLWNSLLIAEQAIIEAGDRPGPHGEQIIDMVRSQVPDSHRDKWLTDNARRRSLLKEAADFRDRYNLATSSDAQRLQNLWDVLLRVEACFLVTGVKSEDFVGVVSLLGEAEHTIPLRFRAEWNRAARERGEPEARTLPRDLRALVDGLRTAAAPSSSPVPLSPEARGH